MSSFFIVSTVTGLYYVGFLKNNYDRYRLFDDLLKIESTYIPRSNIDYIKTNISYNEFVRTCIKLGINNQQDYMKALKECQKDWILNKKYYIFEHTYIHYNNYKGDCMSETNLTRISVKIDENLKDDLKLIAVKNKMTMTDIIVDRIKQYVDENKELLD